MKKILLITAIAAAFATTSVNADTTAVLKVTGQLNWLLAVAPQNSAAAAWLITVLSASPHFPQPM